MRQPAKPIKADNAPEPIPPTPKKNRKSTVTKATPGGPDTLNPSVKKSSSAQMSATTDSDALRREIEELKRSMEARISRAVDELREKDKLLFLLDRRAVMGEMINNIAHQWRQPLNILGLVIQQLPYLHDAGELDRRSLEKKVEKSMEMIRQMSQTIDDFKNFFNSGKEAVSFGDKTAHPSPLIPDP
jgi:C4-dicarboxylate-specific signal transduction histidine kinase